MLPMMVAAPSRPRHPLAAQPTFEEPVPHKGRLSPLSSYDAGTGAGQVGTLSLNGAPALPLTKFCNRCTSLNVNHTTGRYGWSSTRNKGTRL